MIAGLYFDSSHLTTQLLQLPLLEDVVIAMKDGH